MKFKMLQVKNTYQHVCILHFILLRLGQDQRFIARHGIKHGNDTIHGILMKQLAIGNFLII